MQVPFQRKRGLSFREEYIHTFDAELSHTSPCMTPKSPFKGTTALIPAQSDAHRGRITVVLDLDETLVYAREGPLYVRPGVEALLAFLSEHCEVVVWTSGLPSYAAAVIAEIDRHNAVQHVISRHVSWQKSGSQKDLRMLGRDLNSTIIFENTPDCVVGQEGNAVLLPDYYGGELQDETLQHVLALIKELVSRRESDSITVPQFIRACPQLCLCSLPSDSGMEMHCYCLGAEYEDGEGLSTPSTTLTTSSSVSSFEVVASTQCRGWISDAESHLTDSRGAAPLRRRSSTLTMMIPA